MILKRVIPVAFFVIAGFMAGRWFAASERAPHGQTGGSARDSGATSAYDADAGRGTFASEADAAGAFFSAWQTPNRLRRGYELYSVLERLDAAQLRGVAERVQNLNFSDASAMLGLLLPRWVALDHEGAAAWARPAIERVFVGTYGVDFAVCDAWARADPESASKLALSRPFAEGSHRLIGNAVRALAGDQPEAQARRLAELPAGELRESAIWVCLAEWAKKSPADAFNQLALLVPGPRQERARQDVLTTWASQDPRAALAALGDSVSAANAENTGKIANAVAAIVVQDDPKRGSELLLDLPESLRGDALAAGVCAWAKKDAAAALEWGLQNGVALETSVNSGFSSSPMFDAMVKDPKAALAFVQSLPLGEERDRLLNAALRSSQDGSGREFLGDLPAGEQAGAANWLAGVFVGKDVDGALQWVQTLPPGETREAAMRGLFGFTYRKTAEEIEKLIGSLSPGPDRDAGLGSAAEVNAFSTPERALDFASRIVDPTVRARTYRRVTERWMQSQPTAAEAWLATTGEISPAAKAILRRRLEESRGER